MKQIYRKTNRLTALFPVLMIIITITGCGEVPRTKEYLSSDRITAWEKDVEYLQKALPKLHKDLYFSIAEEQFIDSMEELKSKAEHYSDKQMEIAIAEAVAAAGDSHTRSMISAERMYPIALHWYSEGIYIMATDKAHKELLYSRIVTVNGMPIEQAARKMSPLFIGSNESWFENQCVYYLVIPGVLNYFGISDSDEISLALELSGGEKRIVKMKSVSYEDFQPAGIPERKTALYKSRPSELYWYKPLPEYGMLYLNYNSCRQMRDLPFEVFNKDFWDFAARDDAQRLVIDLRNNRGGSSPIFEPFTRKLRKSRFNSTGKLWVIIGKDTFSSAILNSLSLKRHTEAVFIGENTGGEPNHYGEVKEFKLPNSDITVQYSTKYFHWYDGEANTLEPDIFIEESFTADMEGRDPVLEYIINVDLVSEK